MERPNIDAARQHACMTNWHKESEMLALCDYIEYLERQALGAQLELPEDYYEAHPESPGAQGNLATVTDGWTEVAVTEDGRVVLAQSPQLIAAPVPAVVYALARAGMIKV